MPERICRIEGCTNILKNTKGRICQMHRTRFARHGTYDLPQNPQTLKIGQPQLTKLGYLRVNIDGKRVLQHRHIMEQHVGRKLTKDERIHHINGIKTDNRIENLELMMSNQEHMKKYHGDMWKRRKKNGAPSPDTIQSITDRIHLPFGSYATCFCSDRLMARNLCGKHYCWAWRHKLFTAKW